MIRLMKTLAPFVLALACAACAPMRRPDRVAAESAHPPPSAVPARSASASPSAVPEPVPAASAPAYDLESDVAERTATARRELGEKARIAVVQDVFLVVGPPKSPPGSFESALDVVERALHAYFNNRFSRKPARAISVYLFPNAAPYDKFCRTLWDEGCRSPYGVYASHRRLIVMNVGPGIGTLTHELVHPLVEADFPDAPDWINEGIASLFEQFHFPKRGEIAGGKNWRHPRLLRALGSRKERELATLPALFAMSDETFRGDLEDLNYATARYFCQWMDQKKWLWPFYQRWRDGHANDPSGERAFREVTGLTPAEANAQWLRWVRAI